MSDNPQLDSILTQISQINTNLAVNTSETQNIKENIKDMKTDLKLIQVTLGQYVTHVEFQDTIKKMTDMLALMVTKSELQEALKLQDEKNRPASSLTKAIVGFFGVAILTALAALIFKQ